MSPLVLTVLLVVAAALPAKAQALQVPPPIYGVTLDDLTNLNAISASLAALPKKPTARVVFDPDTPASAYLAPLRTLHHDAYIVGEIMDSYYFPIAPDQLDRRAKELVAALKDYVDIWEIGNEINGDWLRPDPQGPEATAIAQEQQIGQMALQTFNTVKAAGGKTMLTLYYNQDPAGNDCTALSVDNWRTWPKQFLPDAVLQGVDYAMLSYYPYQDCQGLTPDWPADFALLESVFPNARVGFGEIGTSMVNAPKSVQQNLITTYYGLIGCALSPRFVGGVFWWNYASQMANASGDYFTLLKSTIAGGGSSNVVSASGAANGISASNVSAACGAGSAASLSPASPTVARRASATTQPAAASSTSPSSGCAGRNASHPGRSR